MLNSWMFQRSRVPENGRPPLLRIQELMSWTSHSLTDLVSHLLAQMTAPK